MGANSIKRCRQHHAHRKLGSIALAVMFLLLIITVPNSALASTNAKIVSQSPANVPKGTTVEDVLVVGSNADIAGTVADTTVVIHGNVHLASTARTGVIIDLGGSVKQDPGARAEAVFVIRFTEPVLNSIIVGSSLVFAVWALRLALSAGLVILPVLLTILLKTTLTVPVDYVKTSVRRVGLTGVLASVACIALITLAAVTVVGLPIAILLLIVYLFIGSIGMACMALWVGGLVRGPKTEERSLWTQTLIGSTFIVAFVNIPLVGPLLLLGLWCVGVGAVTMAVWRLIQSRMNKP